MNVTVHQAFGQNGTYADDLGAGDRGYPIQRRSIWLGVGFTARKSLFQDTECSAKPLRRPCALSAVMCLCSECGPDRIGATVTGRTSAK